MQNPKIFIIAEIGINHNGDLDLAKKMILEAKKWSRCSKISETRYRFSLF